MIVVKTSSYLQYMCTYGKISVAVWSYTHAWPGGSAARWPISRPKSSRGAGKKLLAGKILWPKFGRILSQVAEKGPKFFFCKFLIAEMRKMTQETKKFAQHLDFCRKLLKKITY